MEHSIATRRTLIANRWISVTEKEVSEGGKTPEKYYSLAIPDYVCVIARTTDGRFPLVRQYRPAVETQVWEFPSGTLEPGESPEECAARELVEETGCQAPSLISLGTLLTDVGRLENRLFAYFAGEAMEVADFQPEENLAVHYFDREGLENLIASGEFNFALHLAVWEAFVRKFP